MPLQGFVQGMLGVGIALMAILHLVRLSKRNYSCSWTLSEEGEWWQNGQCKQLCAESKVSAFGICVVLTDISSPRYKSARWIFADQLSVKDYRRLSKVVLRCRAKR